MCQVGTSAMEVMAVAAKNAALLISEKEASRNDASGGSGGANSRFPAHWGEPPQMQTRDHRQLPGGYGMGSSTLAKWISRKIAADAIAAMAKDEA